MLQASSERAAAPLPGAPRLWVPGMSTDAGATTARAREIALRREEMLGMLRDLPEADYELSLTDLVDKTTPPSERKEASPCPSPRSLGPAEQQQQPAPGATKAEKKGRRRSDGGSGSSFRSSSDGVLLNFYMPRSFSRSFTAPRPGRVPSASISSSGRASSVAAVPEDCNKRERDGDAVRCWPLPWDRRWRKSSRRRQDPAATSGELTAILTAADKV